MSQPEDVNSTIPYFEPNSRVTCIEPSQCMYLMILVNQRPKTDQESAYPCLGRETFEFEVALNNMIEVIGDRRKSRIFIPAYKFISDYLNVKQPRGAVHECRLADLIYKPDILLNERKAPIYFQLLFEIYLKDVNEFKDFLQEMDKKLHNFLKSFDIWQRLTGRSTTEEMKSFNSKIIECGNKLENKLKIISELESTLDFVGFVHTLSIASIKSSVRFLKMRDFMYYTLEGYESCLLEIAELVKCTLVGVLHM